MVAVAHALLLADKSSFVFKYKENTPSFLSVVKGTQDFVTRTIVRLGRYLSHSSCKDRSVKSACYTCYAFYPSHARIKGMSCITIFDVLMTFQGLASADLKAVKAVRNCQVIYSQFGLANHQNDHQARRRFDEWAQNEIAIVPDFHKRILFSDEAHFWMNGHVNKQNCRIWSEANPQVYVKTPLHPEKLTVWGALWAGGILLQKR
ncbi:hypothetical protein TNCV_4047281 [Trichonephila clavipes]|nr:hypothetical protein TNCV_4047281 [Trichonephila clavipes]